MTTDIFEFWSRIKFGAHVHPDDEIIFGRMEPARHGFQLGCLPACFAGPLKTAPVVLLYLSPGYETGEDKKARLKETQQRYFARWQGEQLLPEHHWFIGRTKRFGSYEKVREKVAVLNIGTYHSRTMDSYASMLALPSSRVTLDWAQNVLFKEAERGARIVVCMRAASYWGLEAGKSYDGHLYAPQTVRSGFFRKSRTSRKLVEAICQRIGTKPDGE